MPYAGRLIDRRPSVIAPHEQCACHDQSVRSGGSAGVGAGVVGVGASTSAGPAVGPALAGAGVFAGAGVLVTAGRSVERSNHNSSTSRERSSCASGFASTTENVSAGL